MCSGIPETPGQLVQFVVAVQNLYTQQRSLTKPIIAHCRYIVLSVLLHTWCFIREIGSLLASFVGVFLALCNLQILDM